MGWLAPRTFHPRPLRPCRWKHGHEGEQRRGGGLFCQRVFPARHCFCGWMGARLWFWAFGMPLPRIFPSAVFRRRRKHGHGGEQRRGGGPFYQMFFPARHCFCGWTGARLRIRVFGIPLPRIFPGVVSWRWRKRGHGGKAYQGGDPFCRRIFPAVIFSCRWAGHLGWRPWQDGRARLVFWSAFFS